VDVGAGAVSNVAEHFNLFILMSILSGQALFVLCCVPTTQSYIFFCAEITLYVVV
jgi:hypothetical protein